MRTLNVQLGDRAYPIYIGTGLLDRADLLPDRLHRRKVSIITNQTVAALYLKPVAAAFKSRGAAVVEIVLPDGESHKNWETLNQVYDALLSNRCERSTPLIALGGGVIGDITGFAAATYQRGAPFVQMPTTLLAQVDSSVGGKTAINHPLGKNMIGAFYQPAAVIADMSTLDTLPERELAAGIAEIIKYGLIRDPGFLDWLDGNIEKLNARDPETLAYAVERSCSNKAGVVVRDEREIGERALLNFGHTFGHAIEAGMGYGQWLHGEAVAAGMVLAACVSCRLGLLEQPEVMRIVDMLKRAKLPVAAPDLGVERYLDLMGHDKKVVGGKMRFILLRGLGEAFISDAVDAETLSIVLSRPADHV